MTNGIGDAVKRYRTNIGFSQKELAELCGITPTYLSQIEKGKKRPSYSLLEKLCKYLKVEQKDLYKDLFIDSILKEDQSDEQREIVTLLRVLLEKMSNLQNKGKSGLTDKLNQQKLEHV
ncbi:helix-turn-helix transcriptional regulator (plasmid) [Spirosoma taeanense]|uniref:Helix-turn-helix transcriptional regulator n=1 Tax=Spirosoma taeanense TaxID=2735870 RepID=A0A6M5YES7_9BACT|nr:helix-turn-helix transcriptional regulator [Spirosoma taeanense]QJW92478.1 helix-turn-helix transcriptional regulator [Spirosoma taeanense]